MDHTIPQTFQGIFTVFASVFTAPSFANFVTLATGWILASGRHTISEVILAGYGPGRRKHFSSLYRFFARAQWDVDELSKALFSLVWPLVRGLKIHVIVDDTLCRRSGPHFWGAGMHHDPLASTYGRGTSSGRRFAMAFGHNWVVLAIWMPLPWNPDRGIAVPVLWRLYRSKKLTPAGKYYKRTELARQLLAILISWTPKNRRLVLVGDAEYACKTMLRELPEGVVFVGPMPMNAALYDTPKRQPRRGRRRQKGVRLRSPAQLVQTSKVRWRWITVLIYGRKVRVKIKTFQALWHNTCGPRLVRIVVTQDPAKRIDERAYFCTDPEASVEEILQTFAKRWTLEVTFRDAKQHLGLQEPQNGWGKRPSIRRRRKKKPGPQPVGQKGSKAVLRTVPVAMTSYTLVVAWYLQHGNVKADVRLAQRLKPWNRQKKDVSFADMLGAVQRHLRSSQLNAYPCLKRVRRNIDQWLPGLLAAA